MDRTTPGLANRVWIAWTSLAISARSAGLAGVTCTLRNTIAPARKPSRTQSSDTAKLMVVLREAQKVHPYRGGYVVRFTASTSLRQAATFSPRETIPEHFP